MPATSPKKTNQNRVSPYGSTSTIEKPIESIEQQDSNTTASQLADNVVAKQEPTDIVVKQEPDQTDIVVKQETPDQVTSQSSMDVDTLQGAVKRQTPQQGPKKIRFIDWRLLTKEVLAEIITFSDVKKMDKGSLITFSRLNNKRACELLNLDPELLDTVSSGNGCLVIAPPRMPMPFGLSDTFRDEKTGRIKYTITLSLYGQDIEEELKEFDEWYQTVFREAMVEHIYRKAVEFQQDTTDGEELTKRDIRKNFKGMRRDGKIVEGKQYSPQFHVKVKSIKDADDPIIRVWDDKSKALITPTHMQPRDHCQPLIYLDGVVKVGDSYFERFFTQEVVYTSFDHQQRGDDGNVEYPF